MADNMSWFIIKSWVIILKNKNLSAMIYALAAALFYALNVPCSKLLLGNIAPTFMAAFLYIGAGIGVGIMYLVTSKNPFTK